MSEIENNLCGLDRVRKIVVVSSGKGGAGKSTIATQLAISLWKEGLKVGLLDIDLCGPSIPTMIGSNKAEVHKCVGGWTPVYVDEAHGDVVPRFAVMSIGFLLSKPTDSIVWRGPKKSSMVESLLNQVQWGELDCLVIDTPPGTSDEKITLANQLRARNAGQVAGTLLVTSPQRVAISDVRKDITFYQKVGLPIIGLIENMSGLTCPGCHHFDRVFSVGGGEALALARGVSFLGALPLMPGLARLMDSQANFLEKARETLDPVLLDSMAAVGRLIVQ